MHYTFIVYALNSLKCKIICKWRSLAIMAILASQVLLRENKKKIQQQNVTPVSIEPGISVIWIWCSALWAIKAYVTWEICKIFMWSCSIGQFKDIPSDTYLGSPERSLLDLKGWGPRFNTHWGNILLLNLFCFQIAKSLMPILPLLPIFCAWETSNEKQILWSIWTVEMTTTRSVALTKLLQNI